MDTFPDHLRYPDTFESTLDMIHLSQMREKIYHHILRNQQNDFFDIELFNRSVVKDMKKTELMSEIIMKELEPLGWKTFVGYGGTGLFFYDKEKPANAW